MPLKLNSLTPKSGGVLALGNLTVLVGPNNAGKSQTLRDIRDYVVTGSTQQLTIVDRLEVVLPAQTEGTAGLSILPHTSPGHTRILGVASDLQSRHEFAPHGPWLDQHFASVQQPNNRSELLRNMGQYWCAFLDAESRFKLAAPAESYDTRNETPSNALQAFFSGGAPVVEELRKAFKDTFSMDIALDWAAMRRLYLKVGAEFGTIPDTRTQLDALLKDAHQLSEQGDGYKSFAGIALAVLAFRNRLLMIDEPEAFLHPAQTRALGRWIARKAKDRAAQVILASHSADFLLGVISADPDATVIRLNRSAQGTTFHKIPPATTGGLINSPLLSSQPVLDALFHKGVVVCEGDPDRAVYQTVMHQFLRSEGGEEVLLIHSNGKDAAKGPIEMLRSSGTPVCAIVDIDVLNSAATLNEIITALSGLPVDARVTALRDSVATVVENARQGDLLTALKEAVRKWLETEYTDLRRARKGLAASAKVKSRWDAVKRRGVEFFDGADRTTVDDLLRLLDEAGLFVVPRGELEGWMRLGIGKGPLWNRAALEQLHTGVCPDDLNAFMHRVLKFLLPG